MGKYKYKNLEIEEQIEKFVIDQNEKKWLISEHNRFIFLQETDYDGEGKYVTYDGPYGERIIKNGIEFYIDGDIIVPNSGISFETIADMKDVFDTLLKQRAIRNKKGE